MSKVITFISKMLMLFCNHRWAYVERINLGVDIFAKFTCQKCRKSAYVPYSGGDNSTKYDSYLL